MYIQVLRVWDSAADAAISGIFQHDGRSRRGAVGGERNVDRAAPKLVGPLELVGVARVEQVRRQAVRVTLVPDGRRPL
eukprot:7381137-Prymnesium_polylepis.1